jgi:hypothetical protein
VTGFAPQPNAWQCGPFALKHALLALGVVTDEGELTHAARATVHGADETDLARAAARYGCVLGAERYHAPGAARAALAGHLRARRPVLLCVDRWRHWIAAVGMEHDAVIVLDSRLAFVFEVQPWTALAPRVAYPAPRGAAWYDLHPVIARRARTFPARFSLARAGALRAPRERDLGRHWGRYLARLTAVSCPHGAQREWTVAVGDVLRREAVELAGGLPAPVRERAERELAHAAFVADTHALEAPLDQVPALVRVAASLAAA